MNSSRKIVMKDGQSEVSLTADIADERNEKGQLVTERYDRDWVSEKAPESAYEIMDDEQNLTDDEEADFMRAIDALSGDGIWQGR